jgi:benzodiazapine receptor
MTEQTPNRRTVPLSRWRDIAGLALWLLACFATAAIGGIASRDAGVFYGQLIRPDWAPPAWLFAPVWSALYLTIAIAAWLAWRARGFAGARAVLPLFIAQLFVNALWTWLFFVWKLGALAFVDVVLLVLLVVPTMIGFWRIRRLAGVLLLPYVCWIAYASALTLSVWRANPGTLD